MKTLKKLRKPVLFSLGLAFSISAVLFTACKKEEKTPEPEPAAPAPAPALTNTQKLAGKNFKATACTVDPGINTGSVTITNWYAQMENCSKDDLVNFNTNGTYTFDEGATKCDPTDPQTTSGTWLWNTNETILTIKEGSTTSSYNVLVNDGTTLKYT